MTEPRLMTDLETLKEVVVRKYGLLPPANWGPDCDDELARQSALWNRLVEIERDHRNAYFALIGENSDVAAMEAELAAKIERRDTLRADQKGRRQKARSRKIDDGDLRTEIQALTGEIKALSADLKAKRKEVRETLKEPLRVLSDARFAAVKAARQQSGCWWGNYNAVVGSYEVARKRALATGGELRFHRHDGSGRITNQIQGGMTVADLFAGAHSQVQVEPLAADVWAIPGRGDRDRACHTILTATIFTRDGQRRAVSWPMVMHRPIPDDVRIKEVVITRERVGADFRWAVVFTCTREAAPVQAAAGHLAAVDIGWRVVNSGLRVATLVREDGQTDFVVLPAEVIGKFDHVTDIQSRRSGSLNEFLAKLREVPWNSAPAILRDIAKPVCQSPKIGYGRVAALVLRWRQDFADWRPGDLETAEAWRKQDKRLWLEQVNLADKVRARRKEFYRLEARRILDGVSALILEDFNMAEAARVKGQDPALPDAARRNRVIAAPYEFRLCLEQAADKAGVPRRKHVGKSTWICHVCGAEVRSAHPENLGQTCENGHTWDQDVNAGWNMLAGAARAAE